MYVCIISVHVQTAMKSPMVAKAASRYPMCVDILLPLWAVVAAEGSPPIWTDVAFSTRKEDEEKDAPDRSQTRADTTTNITITTIIISTAATTKSILSSYLLLPLLPLPLSPLPPLLLYILGVCVCVCVCVCFVISFMVFVMFFCKLN